MALYSAQTAAYRRTILRAAREELQECLRSDMTEHGDAQFDEATLSQLAAENNLESEQ